MARGKLIVIDGVDASGKSTQAEIIAKRLLSRGVKAELISFPCYSEEWSAPVRMYLGGRFGDRPEDVGPYAASCFYAVDRYCSFKTDWGKKLEEGVTLVSARYTTSNAIHQGEKFPKKEQKAYFEWLYEFEFGKLGLPRPDLVVYLDMPPEKSEELLCKRYDGDERKKDIHEKDGGYLVRCHETANYAAKVLGWERVDCVKDGRVRSREDIADEIMKKIDGLKENEI